GVGSGSGGGGVGSGSGDSTFTAGNFNTLAGALSSATGCLTLCAGIFFGLLLVAGLAGCALGACWLFGTDAHSRRSYLTPMTRLSANDFSDFGNISTCPETFFSNPIVPYWFFVPVGVFCLAFTR